MPTALNDAKKSAFISGLIYCAIKSSYCSTVIRSGGHLPHSAGLPWLHRSYVSPPLWI